MSGDSLGVQLAIRRCSLVVFYRCRFGSIIWISCTFRLEFEAVDWQTSLVRPRKPEENTVHTLKKKKSANGRVYSQYKSVYREFNEIIKHEAF